MEQITAPFDLGAYRVVGFTRDQRRRLVEAGQRLVVRR